MAFDSGAESRLDVAKQPEDYVRRHLAESISLETLIEIALEVGYTSPSHFAHVFRREVGTAPTQFRNAL